MNKMALDLAQIRTMSKHEIEERIAEVRHAIATATSGKKTDQIAEKLTIEKVKRMSAEEIAKIIDEVRALFEAEGKKQKQGATPTQGGGQFND